MKDIQDTEIYKILFKNAKPVTNDSNPMIRYRLFETDVVFAKHNYFESSYDSESAKKDLAYYATLDILKKCGITTKDLELLRIAEELAKED